MRVLREKITLHPSIAKSRNSSDDLRLDKMGTMLRASYFAA